MADVSEILGSPPVGEVLNTRWYADIDGRRWEDIVNIEIESRSYNQTGVFTIDADFSSSGEVNRNVINPGSRLDQLLRIRVPPVRVPVIIYGGYDDGRTAQLPVIFRGYADRAFIDRKKDVVTITGRDRSVIFVESFIHTQFRNKTTSGAVAEIAERHGMKTNIVDQGSDLGTAFEYDEINTICTSPQGLNEWTVLTKLAEYDGCAVFVSVDSEGNDVLNYIPFESYDKVIRFEWGNNIDDLELEKNFGLNSSRVGIELASTQTKKKDNILATAGATRGGDSIMYRYVIGANVDVGTAQFLAEMMGLFHAQLEFVVTMHSSGHPEQLLTNRMRLVNATSDFDRLYRIIRVNWQLGMDCGWKAELTGLAAPTPDHIHQVRKRRSLQLTVGKR